MTHKDSRSQGILNFPARSIEDALSILGDELEKEKDQGRTITSATIAPFQTSQFRYMVIVISGSPEKGGA